MLGSRILAIPLSILIAGIATPLTAATHTSPVKVSTCDPLRNVVSSAPAYVRYAPGYYPVGRYAWRDVYGRTYYQYPISTTAAANPQLAIDYVNVEQKTMKSIEFGLVARGTLVAEVRDVGTFSPGVEIKHTFGLDPNVFPIGTGLARCVPLRVTYEDGTKWKNPRLPALRGTATGPSH
jgi:hypothetical protein